MNDADNVLEDLKTSLFANDIKPHCLRLTIKSITFTLAVSDVLLLEVEAGRGQERGGRHVVF